MKVEVKKVDATKREMKFVISKERVAKTLDEIYKDLGKVAKIKGFRQGKVPRNILESQHSKVAQEETIKKLIPEVYQEAVVQEKLTPIDMPEIHDVSLKDGIVTFVAKVDIKPEVVIKDYKGIKITKKDSKVTDEEINKTLEYFKKGQGEEKDVVLDDNFAKGLGFPTLDDFKKSIARQMEMDKDRFNKMDIENQIVETLIKKAKLSIPQSLVKKQMEHRISETKNRLKSQGMPEEDIDKKEDQMRKELQPTVEKDIKTYLILDKIAQLENIEVKENENLVVKVMEFLLKEAKWN